MGQPALMGQPPAQQQYYTAPIMGIATPTQAPIGGLMGTGMPVMGMLDSEVPDKTVFEDGMMD